MECSGYLHALLAMWMVLPNQAASLQGSLCVNRDILAVNDLGIGSGWQQSKQNWALAAVVGQRIRMEKQWPLQCGSCTTPPLFANMLPSAGREDLTSESALLASTPTINCGVMRYAYTWVKRLGPCLCAAVHDGNLGNYLPAGS